MDTAEEQKGSPLTNGKYGSSLVYEETLADVKNCAADGEELQMLVDDDATSSQDEDVIYTGPQDCEVLSISSSSEESFDSDVGEAGKSTESSTVWGGVDDEPHCVIEMVSGDQFSSSSIEDAVKQGRPGIPSSLSDCCTLVSLFRRKAWLTACDRMKKMFCWPCLLFGEKYIWSCGFAKVSFISIALTVNKHEVTDIHKKCLSELETMEQREKDRKKRSELCQLLRTELGGIPMTPSDENIHADSMLIGKLLSNKSKDELTDKFIWKLLTYGRPRPKMQTFLTHYNLRELPYESVPWLTASEPMCMLFCWPCLLFVSHTNWSQSPSGNFNALETSMKSHENTVTHMLSMLKLKELQFRMEGRENEVEPVNSKYSSGQLKADDRVILKRAVEAVCCLKKKSNVAPSVDDYIRLMEFLGCCDCAAEKSGESHKYEHYLSLVTKYLTGISEVIEFFIISAIIKEVNEAHFVSLILEDTSPSLNHSLIAVIVRFIDNQGEVHERFVKFIPLKYNRRSDGILQHIETLMSMFDCESKLVGFTYDGGVIHPDCIPEFNEEMKSLYPLAHFFPYREHDLRRTIIQALSHTPKLRLFYHQLCDMSNFFEETPNAISTFLGIVYQRNADAEIAEKVWDFSSCFAVTLWDYRGDVLAVFEKITTNPEEWSSETVIRAFEFLNFLKNPENLGLILATKIILSAIEDLPPLLAGPFELENWKKTVRNAAFKLTDSKKNLCPITNNMASNTKQECSVQTFHLMLDTAQRFILNRYESLDSLSNFTLPDNSDELVRRNAENADEWLGEFSSILDPERLSTQMRFLIVNPFFARKSLPEKLKSIHEYDMVETLKESFKFLQLVLSIPFADPTDSSAVRKMRSYVKDNTNLTTTDALIWMEQDLLTRLESDAEFVDRVIELIT